METERLNDNAVLASMAGENTIEVGNMRYYVVFTEPNCEMKAREHLKQRGFAAWVPIEEFTRYRTVQTFCGPQRRKIEDARPIFRGYIFIPLNLAWSFGSLYGCPGVRQNGNPFLVINEQPVYLRPSDVAKIERCERSCAKPGKPTSPYKPGDDVLIDGYAEAARIVELDDKGRIKALMMWLGAEREVLTDVLKIAPAS